MSKPFSTDLHLLAGSLNRTEKAYLKKLYSSSGNKKEKKFIRLFNAVESGMLPGEIGSPRMKHYLYGSILRSLDAYHAGASIEIRLRKMLNAVEVLYEKALYAQCRKIIAKGKKMAYRYEKFTLLLQFIRFEISLTVASFDLHSIHQKADLLQQEVYAVLEKIRNISEFLTLYSKIFTLILEEGTILNPVQKNMYDTIMRSPLLAEETRAVTNYSRLLYYHIRAVYANALNDSLSHYRYSLKMVRHIEEHPTLFEEEKERYVIGLNNVLLALLEMGRFPEIGTYLGKLRSLPQALEKHESENIGVRAFARSYIIELSSLTRQGEFAKCQDLAGPVKKGIVRFGDKINRSNFAELCYYMAYAFFGAGNYREANVWLNKVLNNKQAEGLSLYESAWMLHLFVRFEMGDYDYLEYRIRAVENLLRKKNRPFGIKDVLLKFMAGYIRDPRKSNEEFRKAYQALRDELRNAPQGSKSQFGSSFDIISWISSKLEKCRFDEAVKKRVNRK